MRRRWLGSALLALGGCGAGTASAPPASPPAPATPPDALVELRAQPLAGAQWGILAVDLATGDTLLALEPDRRLIPGSTLKLLTATTALDELGPDFRWETGLWGVGRADSASLAATGTLEGDLVLVGSGDPSLSARWWDSDTEPLDFLASWLGELGVRRVAGTLVIDASAIDSTGARPSWMVEDLPVPAGAPGGAFVLADGETHVELRGGSEPGDPVEVRWWPFGEDGFVRSRLTTVVAGPGTGMDVTAHWLPESRVLELTGSVPVGRTDTLALANRDPVRQTAAALHRVLTARGVAIDGGWRVAWSTGEPLAAGCVSGEVAGCAEARLLRTVHSPSLLDVVRGTLEPSQNWMAEQIARTLGGRRGWDIGIQDIADHIQHQRPVDPRDVRVVDGSGLSVQSLVSARALVAVLGNARSQPWGEAFRAGLAEPGEEESTLEMRLLGLEGRVFAKTGTLTNVSSLADYLIDDGGREVAFAILVNGSNLPGAAVRGAIDRIVRSLAAGR